MAETVQPEESIGLDRTASDNIKPMLTGGKSDDDGYESLGNKLFVAAWTIEIIAACVGLFMAIIQIVDATQTQGINGRSTVLNAIPAALPFFAVAIIELTKIPLATVFYKTTVLRWKIIFISGLLLTMGITFETFFLGFERYFSLLSLEVYELQLDINSTKADVSGADAKKANALSILDRKGSEEATHQNNMTSNKEQYDDRVAALNDQRVLIIEKYAGNLGPLKEGIKSAAQHIKQHKVDLDQALKNIDADYAARVSACHLA